MSLYCCVSHARAVARNDPYFTPPPCSPARGQPTSSCHAALITKRVRVKNLSVVERRLLARQKDVAWRYLGRLTCDALVEYGVPHHCANTTVSYLAVRAGSSSRILPFAPQGVMQVGEACAQVPVQQHSHEYLLKQDSWPEHA